MIDYALNRIEAELLKLAEEAKHAPIDSYRLAVIARQIAEQRDMMAKGLGG